MREIRLSGSVEGVVSDHDSYSHSEQQMRNKVRRLRCVIRGS